MIIIKIVLIIFLNTLVSSDQNGNGYEPGDIARDFKLKNVDGSYVSMTGNPENKGYLVIFSCNTCPWVKRYESRMIALHKKYAPKGYPVIAINPNDVERMPGDSFEAMKQRAKEMNYPFPYVQDETQEIARAYGASNTPQVYVLQKEGKKFRVKYIGAIDDNPRDANAVQTTYVEDAVDALLNGEKVPVKKAKAIGCTIKWKTS